MNREELTAKSAKDAKKEENKKEFRDFSAFRGSKNKLLLKEECYEIQGAAFEVYKEMGCGFLEAVYQECLEKELAKRSISFQSQVELHLNYKGEQLNQTYKPDFICFDKIIVEIKAVKELASEHKAQLLNYLKATGLELGLLVNFGSYPKVEIIRMANSNFRDFSAFRGSKGGAE